MKFLKINVLLFIVAVTAIMSACDSDTKATISKENTSEKAEEYYQEKLTTEPGERSESPSVTPPSGEERQSKINNLPEPFTEFWLRFKKYLLAEDYAALAKLTRFPLLARGTDDADPVTEYSQAQFSEIMQTVLHQPVLNLDDQGNLLESNLLQDIKAMQPLLEKPEQGERSRRVKDFQFERIDQSWYLVEVYVAAK